eukprot:264589_1
MLGYELCCIITNTEANDVVSNAVLSTASQIELLGGPRKPMFPQITTIKQLQNHFFFKNNSFDTILTIFKSAVICPDLVTASLVALAIFNNNDQVYVDTATAEEWLKSQCINDIQQPSDVLLSPKITVRKLNINDNNINDNNINDNNINNIVTYDFSIPPLQCTKIDPTEFLIRIENQHKLMIKTLQSPKFHSQLMVITTQCTDQDTYRDIMPGSDVPVPISDICGATSPVIAQITQNYIEHIGNIIESIASYLISNDKTTINTVLPILSELLSNYNDEMNRDNTLQSLKQYIINHNLNDILREQSEPEHEFYKLLINDVEHLIANHPKFRKITHIVILNNCDDIESLLLKGSWPPDLRSKIKLLNAQIISQRITDIFLVQFNQHYYMNILKTDAKYDSIWLNVDTRNPNSYQIENMRPFPLLHHVILHHHKFSDIKLQCIGILDIMISSLKHLEIESNEYKDDLSRIFADLIKLQRFNIRQVQPKELNDILPELAKNILEDIDNILELETHQTMLSRYLNAIQVGAAKHLDLVLCARQHELAHGDAGERLAQIVQLKLQTDHDIQNDDMYANWDQSVLDAIHLTHTILFNFENKEQKVLTRLQLQFESDRFEAEDMINSELYTELWSGESSYATLECEQCSKLLCE